MAIGVLLETARLLVLGRGLLLERAGLLGLALGGLSREICLGPGTRRDLARHRGAVIVLAQDRRLVLDLGSQLPRLKPTVLHLAALSRTDDEADDHRHDDDGDDDRQDELGGVRHATPLRVNGSYGPLPRELTAPGPVEAAATAPS